MKNAERKQRREALEAKGFTFICRLSQKETNCSWKGSNPR